MTGRPPPSGRSYSKAPSKRLKTARGRSVSSQAWLERQINDPYVQAAKDKGYRSRAAYKLLEIDAKNRLLRAGARVVDLGAAPGGWTQVAVEKAGKSGRVIGADIQPMEPIPGAMLLELDFLDPEAPGRVEALLDGPADLVMSDMAAHATGHRPTDHLKIMALCEAALDFAINVLAPGGAFLCKVLQGGTEATLLARMKRNFTKVTHVKPPASRADSSEMYVLAQGFKGRD